MTNKCILGHIQNNDEFRAVVFSFYILSIYLSVMRLDDLFADREAEAGMVAVGFVRGAFGIKAFEYCFQFIFRDARALIFDFDGDVVLLLFYLY